MNSIWNKLNSSKGFFNHYATRSNTANILKHKVKAQKLTELSRQAYHESKCQMQEVPSQESTDLTSR